MAGQPESQPKTTDIDEESITCYCPLGGVMGLLSRKYAMQLICVVGALGPVRYGEIEATFGEVSSSTCPPASTSSWTRTTSAASNTWRSRPGSSTTSQNPVRNCASG